MELKKGQTIMMAVDLQMRAEIFQEAISNRAGLPHDKFALYYQSKQIEGEAMLRSYGIGKDATIEVKFRGRGGMPMGGDDPAPKSAKTYSSWIWVGNDSHTPWEYSAPP